MLRAGGSVVSRPEHCRARICFPFGRRYDVASCVLLAQVNGLLGALNWTKKKTSNTSQRRRTRCACFLFLFYIITLYLDNIFLVEGYDFFPSLSVVLCVVSFPFVVARRMRNILLERPPFSVFCSLGIVERNRRRTRKSLVIFR